MDQTHRIHSLPLFGRFHSFALDCPECQFPLDSVRHVSNRPWTVRCPECKRRYDVGMLILPVRCGVRGMRQPVEYRKRKA